MRIAFVNTLYWPQDGIGGAEVTLRLLAARLSARGHRCTILTLARPGEGEHRGEVDGVPAHYLPLANIFSPHQASRPTALRPLYQLIDAYNPVMQRRLERVLRELRPDVVHCHNLQGFSISAWAAADRLGIPIVHTVHDHYLACPRGVMWRPGRGSCETPCPACRLFATPRRALSGLPYAITAVSHRVLDRLAAAGVVSVPASQVRVIRCNNPDDATAVAPPPPAAGQGGPLRLGYLGRLMQPKGIEDLLDAVKALPPGAVTLRIAGRGEEAYQQALHARAAAGAPADIAFLGHVSPRNVLPHIDLLVVPSILEETLGRGVHEAWAYGVPSLVTPLGGPAEQVTPGRTGFVAPGVGAQPLRHALEALLRDGWDRAAVREACLSAARAHAPDVITSEYEAVLAAAARRAPLPAKGAGAPWPRRQHAPPPSAGDAQAAGICRTVEAQGSRQPADPPSAHSRPRLRFAVLHEAGKELSRWQAACVSSLLATGEAELVGTLTTPRAMAPAGGDRVSQRLFAAILRLGSRARLPDSPPGDAAAERLSAPPLTPERVAYDSDALLAFVPEGINLPEAPPLGVWQLRFGGLDPHGPVLPGFPEFAWGRPTVRAEVVASGGRMGTGRVLHHAELKLRRSPGLTRDALLLAAPGLYAGACRRVQRDCLPETAGPTAPYPRPVGLLRAAAAPIRRLVLGAASRLFLRDAWTVGIVEAPLETVLRGETLPAPRWLAAPRPGRFHADPFPVMVGGKRHLLFEMWSDAEGRGWIAATALDGAGGRSMRDAATAIDLGCHMSYPATFEFEGETYCAPEAWQAGGLRLFRMGRDAWDWQPAGHALGSLPVVDPTLFEHDGRWWLLAGLEGAMSDGELHAWHAATPFGPWAPHPLNPVRSDVRASRPAGAVFRSGGALYRPAQDCSVHYGAAVVVNRILRLDPNVFEEVEVTRLEPGRDWPYPHGLHTLNACGDGWLVIDAKRRMIDPLGPLRGPMARWRRDGLRPLPPGLRRLLGGIEGSTVRGRPR